MGEFQQVTLLSEAWQAAKSQGSLSETNSLELQGPSFPLSQCKKQQKKASILECRKPWFAESLNLANDGFHNVQIALNLVQPNFEDGNNINLGFAS